MFRQWLSTSAMTFIATCFFLAPQPASAQTLGLYDGYFGRPIYFSPYAGPADRALVTPPGSLGMPLGGYGATAPATYPYGAANPFLPLPFGYGSYSYYQPLSYSAGLYNYSRPFGYNAAITTPPLTYRDPIMPALYSLAPGTAAVSTPVTYLPSYYFRPVSYVGYPNYVYTPGSLEPLPTYYATPLSYVPYPGMYSAYGLGPTTFAADGGLALGSTLAPLRISTNYPLSTKPGAQNALAPEGQGGKIRPALYPPVAVPGSDSLLRESVGATQSDKARLEVILPSADAEVWFQGTKTTRTGKVREFVSPPLSATDTYAYEVRARWMVDGEPVTRTETVRVRAGERVRIDFTKK
jgi:uncharacterized protein (TIGR03000 family)